MLHSDAAIAAAEAVRKRWPALRRVFEQLRFAPETPTRNAATALEPAAVPPRWPNTLHSRTYPVFRCTGTNRRPARLCTAVGSTVRRAILAWSHRALW